MKELKSKKYRVSNIALQVPETKVYKKRWLVLVIFILYSSSNALQWIDPVQHYREHRGRILQGLQLFGGHDQHDIHDILHLVHIPSELFAR